MTTSPDDLYKATTASFRDTMMVRNAHIGYRIPEYQRAYNWDRKNVQRLVKDCLDSFYRFCDAPAGSAKFTYLGSMIAAMLEPEPTFSGHSAEIIDGQQRLTTLVLMSCCVHLLLEEFSRPLEALESSAIAQLQKELAYQQSALGDCVIGTLQTSEGNVPYPKLVRSDDVRAQKVGVAYYQSPVATAIEQYRLRAGSDTVHTTVEEFSANIENPQFQRSIRVISRELRASLCSSPTPNQTSRTEIDSLKIDERAVWIGNARTLLRFGTEVADAIFTLGKESPSLETASLCRLLLFASYMTNHVVLTSIHTRSEEDAFAIFDALNTTGSPLTALDTCKPLVTSFEKRQGPGFAQSESRRYWSRMEVAIAAAYPKPGDQEAFVQKLVIAFGLYVDGTSLGRDLAEQRRYLRDSFRTAEAESSDAARRFVVALSDVVQFYLACWANTDLSDVNQSGWSQEEVDTLRLALVFVRDMNTTLAIPILARYWVVYRSGSDSREFLEAAKAIAAFLVLRRAITGNTGGIDDEFRSVMKRSFGPGELKWSAGPTFVNEVPSASKLRERLRQKLATGAIEVTSKESWVDRVSQNDLGRSTHKAVCRLLVLAAADQARPEDTARALWVRDDLIHGAERVFLSYGNWVDPRYKTVEHVAPDGKDTDGWDDEIYRHPVTRNLIGNLVLLPEKCNTAIANAPWRTKRLFYRALASRSLSAREEAIREAGVVGSMFGPKAERIIRTEDSLHLLDAFADVQEWTAEIVADRTSNVLELAWERVSPWLF